MFRKQATPPQFSMFTTFALGRGLRLAVLVMVLGINVRMVEASDLIYVSLADNTIVTYDVSLSTASDITNSKQVFANTGLNRPAGMVLDHSGNLYAANYSGNNITKYDSSGKLISTLTASGMSGPVGLAFDSAGNLYSSSNTSGNVFKLDASGSHVPTFILSISSAYGMAFDERNNLYVVSNAGHSISQIDQTGAISASISSNLYYPSGISMSSDGRFFVPNDLANSISIFNYSPSLQYAGGFGTAFSRPNSIAFDSQGYLYVTYTNTYKVSKYDTLGNLQLSWDLSTQAIDLAFSHVNVPEPSTYALGLIAAGAIGFVSSRRKRRQNHA